MNRQTKKKVKVKEMKERNTHITSMTRNKRLRQKRLNNLQHQIKIEKNRLKRVLKSKLRQFLRPPHLAKALRSRRARYHKITT